MFAGGRSRRSTTLAYYYCCYLGISSAPSPSLCFRPLSPVGSSLVAQHTHWRVAAASATARTRRFGMMTTKMKGSFAAGEEDGTKDTNNRILKVALLQFPVTTVKSTNLATCAQYIAKAAAAGAQLLVLPEIWNSPYATAAFPEYAEDLSSLSAADDDDQQSSSSSASPSTHLLRQLARKHQIWIVGGSIPEVDTTTTNNKRFYNTCQVFNPMGEIVAKHRKVHLFDIDVPNGIRFMESETLSAGNAMTHFNTPCWGNIGIGICYDLRFPEYALALRHQFHCNILIYPGAFNMTTGPAHWELLQRARAVDCQCFVLTASPARSDPPPTTTTTAAADDAAVPANQHYPHYTAWGHSTAVSPWGDVLATRDETAGIVYADLDLKLVDEMRHAIPTSRQKRTDLYSLDVVPGSPPL
jgi:omega-amidase